MDFPSTVRSSKFTQCKDIEGMDSLQVPLWKFLCQDLHNNWLRGIAHGRKEATQQMAKDIAQRIQSSLPTTSATDPTSQQRILELETEPVKATQGDTSSPPDPPGTSNSVGMTPIQRALITRKFILRALVRPGSPLGHPRHGQLHGLKKTNLLLCRTQATKIA